MRVIARLDIKNEHLIKGIHFEGLRKLGCPQEYAESYYNQGVDELIFMDAVASLYDRNNLFETIARVAKNIFVPITLGGGIRTLDDIENALHSGADKVAINTQAVRQPQFITESALKYGSQAIVGSIEAKSADGGGKWWVYTDNGRENSGVDVVTWAKELERLGVGEIILTSIDKEGTMRGFDIELAREVDESVNVPIILGGGYGELKHLDNLELIPRLSGIAIAAAFHYKKSSISDVHLGCG